MSGTNTAVRRQPVRVLVRSKALIRLEQDENNNINVQILGTDRQLTVLFARFFGVPILRKMIANNIDDIQPEEINLPRLDEEGNDDGAYAEDDTDDEDLPF